MVKTDYIPSTDNEWKDRLTPQQYQVLRKKGTERAFTGELLKNKETGTYNCAGCGSLLFPSDTKFDSGTGWPSFSSPIAKKAITLKDENAHGMHRIEVCCVKCGGHLGHVFSDGPSPKGQRFCINSCALSFKKK